VESLGAAVAQSGPVDVNAAERQRMFEMLGAIKATAAFRELTSVTHYRALATVRDERLYRFYDSGKGKRTSAGAVFRPCQSFKEFLVSIGMSESSFYEMEREVKAMGCATAQFLREIGVQRDVRRRLLSAPDSMKAAIADVAEEAAAGGDQAAVAMKLDAILDALENAEEQQARLATLEEKAAKSAERMEKLSGENFDMTVELREKKKSIQQLERDIRLPAGLRDRNAYERVAKGYEFHVMSILGHVEEWVDGLAADLESGRKDRAAILRVLGWYRWAIETLGHSYGDALHALATGENEGEYIKHWAQHAIWSGNGEPGDEALLEDKG